MNFINLKTAFRNLQKNKLISFLNILGLATALAVVILISNYSYFEFETDKYHQNMDDIYVVKNEDKAHVPYEMAPLIREQISGVKYISLVESNFKNDFVLQYKNEESIKTEIIFAGEDITNIFSFESLSGNLKNALSIPQSIVLTESESKRLFGDDNPIGKTLMLKGNNDYLGKSDVEVRAVIKDLPKNSNLQFKSMVSFNTSKKMMFWIDQCIWSCANVQNYVLLEEGQDPQLLAAQMSETLRSHIPDKVDSNFSLLHYSKVYFSSIRDGFNHGSVKLIYTLGFVALLILIIATINYINLSIAGSAKRRSEIGIRKLVGVRPFQLVSQLLSESVLISLIAMIAGVLLAWLITPYINSLSIIHLPVLKLSSISLWIILIGGSVLIGLMAGILPALSFNKFKAIALLSKRMGKQAGGINLRRGLIVFQFITSIMLIICTITVTRQLYLVKNTDMGFDVNNIINIKLSPEVNMPVFKDKLAQNSGIEAVSFSRWYPGNIGENWGMPLVVDGVEKEVSFACENADANYIDLMGLEMVQGRKFSDELKSDIGSAIINEAAVEAFELENPMEAVFQKRGVTRKIVGVVKDFNFQSLHNKIGPLVIFCEDETVFSVNVKLVPGNFNRISKTIGEIKTAWNEVSPGFPFEFKFIDQQVEELYKSEMIFEKIFRFGAFFAILISCLGLFGLVLGSTEQRRKEIGIRKVNGAKIGEVLLMLNKDYIKWVLISFVIASPLAWFIMNKWLENFAYKTTLSWWIFALAGVLALGIALLTVSWQSWRAATRNPVEALRYE